jgi:chromatin segregation and condensation protein Rec8/ScpA/Scc1 (kleisin family)
MSSTIQKPFYFQPPWNILFELHRLQKILPWDVNISFLLMSFLGEMEKRGEIDFRASGMALDSSATIYLLKSKLLLKLEEPPPSPKPPPDFLAPPLVIPLRYELTSTTIQHLLTVLEDALKGERPSDLKLFPESTSLPPPEILPPIDRYLMAIEEQMNILYRRLIQLANKGKLIVFSQITAGLRRLEAIKRFITLLFLAQRGKVGLWQGEDSDDIYITVAEDSAKEGNEAENV